LKNKGLVSLTVYPHDKRKKILTLTDAGCSKLLEAKAFWQVARKDMDKALGEENVRNMVTSLKKASQLVK
jgi:DNA-binding MarR family transcriptional regulator